MKTATAEKKTGRLDLRMTEEQRREIDQAASINGMSVSQWSLKCLMDSARKEISEQGLMRLSAESFDAFAALLESESSATFERFRQETTRWER